MLLWDTSTTSHRLISLMQRRMNNEADITIRFIYEVWTKIDRPHLYQKDQRIKKKRLHWSRCKNNRDKRWILYLSQQKKERYWMINSILKCDGTWNGWAQIGKSTSQKNVKSQPQLPLLSGLQHLGGTHTRGLRIGKDGNNTAGRMIIGQTRGDRWSNLWSQIYPRETGGSLLQESYSRQNHKILPPSRYFLKNCVFASCQTQLLNATGGVHRTHFLERAQHTFSREHMTVHSVAQD